MKNRLTITVDVDSGKYSPEEALKVLNFEMGNIGEFVLIGQSIVYDPNFGDDKLCVCDHPYYRHFDTYDHMKDVGCKYCSWDECEGFKLK